MTIVPSPYQELVERLPTLPLTTQRGVFVCNQPLVEARSRVWVARGERQQTSWVWIIEPERRAIVELLEALSLRAPGAWLAWRETLWVDDHALMFFDPPPGRPVRLTPSTWRALDPGVAVACLASLTHVIEAMHAVGLGSMGVLREYLWLEPQRGQLWLGAAPRLNLLSGDDVEEPWLDLRVFAEMIYENTLRAPYPGDFELAASLSTPEAQRTARLLEPGFVQLLAGCVTPHGDAAFTRILEVREGLETLRLERLSGALLQFGQASTVGSYIFRKSNQDACGHIAMRTTQGSRDGVVGFCCVADGIGGLEDGERASGLTVRSACEAFARAWAHYGVSRLSEDPVAFARSIAKVVSQHLTLHGELFPEGNRGGTTFTGLLFAGEHVGVAHVGDSRAYLLRDDKLIQLTEDHNLGSLLRRLEEIDPELAGSARNPRTISRFMSTNHELCFHHIDSFGYWLHDVLGERAPTQRHGLRVRRGDLFLLTSDGVHEELPHRELIAICQRFIDEPQRICDELVRRAIERVGRDNATALAVRIS